MSTNSTITLRRNDGSETSIYCHWDGYISGVGVTLQLAYNTAEKIEKLLELGDLSSLHYYTEPTSNTHDFENPEQDICVAYHRDRGEEFRQSGGENEYNYIFDERECVWYVEQERYTKGTEAMKVLSLDYSCTRTKTLLLDEILKIDFTDHWCDDEFATKENVHEVCKQKAREARQAIIDRERESYDSYYRAYCD